MRTRATRQRAEIRLVVEGRGAATVTTTDETKRLLEERKGDWFARHAIKKVVVR